MLLSLRLFKFLITFFILILLYLLLSSCRVLATTPYEDLSLDAQMTDNTPPPRVEESASALALQEWYNAHCETGGTYTLTEDIIINDRMILYLPDAPITINTGSYHIYIMERALFETAGSVSIIGDGGTDGLVNVAPNAVFSISGITLTATNGTAIYYKPYTAKYSTYLGNTYVDAPTKITASGANACAVRSDIVMAYPSKAALSFMNCQIEVNGKNSTAVQAYHSIEMTHSTVTASGDSAQSIITEAGTITLFSSTASPESNPSVTTKILWEITELEKPEIIIPPDTPFEDCGAPQYLQAKLLSTDGLNTPFSLPVPVIWDTEAYAEGLKSGETFTISGSLGTTPLVNPDTYFNPVLTLIIKEHSAISDLRIVLEDPTSIYGTSIFFTTPKGASKIILQSSADDGITWSNTDITQSIHFAENPASYILPYGRNHMTYRLKIVGSSYAGYSNVVTHTWATLPESEEEDIDGGRGGGGRDEPTPNKTDTTFHNLLQHDYIIDSHLVKAFDSDFSNHPLDNNKNSKVLTTSDPLDQKETNNFENNDKTNAKTDKNPLLTLTKRGSAIFLFAFIIILFILVILILNPDLRHKLFHRK